MKPPEECKFLDAGTAAAYKAAYRLWRYDSLVSEAAKLTDALVELRDKTSCTEGQYRIIDAALK